MFSVLRMFGLLQGVFFFFFYGWWGGVLLKREILGGLGAKGVVCRKGEGVCVILKSWVAF